MRCLQKDLFIYEKESGGGRGRGRESQADFPPWVQNLTWGHGASSHDSWDHDLSWNQELHTQMTEPPRHPKAWIMFDVNPIAQWILGDVSPLRYMWSAMSQEKPHGTDCGGQRHICWCFLYAVHWSCLQTV